MDMLKMTPLELGAKIKAKEISVAESTQYYLNRLKNVDSEVHSFIRTEDEYALTRAKEVQKDIDCGKNLSPLAG
ncbi:MAG: Asp-tRNA(Asn)/Glu-tRNA(Gln) amidotransferase subunit GatA, partial [Clostridiales bacterium]